MRRTSRGWATHQVHEGDGAGFSAGMQNTTHTRKNTRVANWGGDHLGTAGAPTICLFFFVNMEYVESFKASSISQPPTNKTK
jgi:hypothetical protein